MGTIAISYRSEDGAATAGRVYDRLAAHFGRESIALDSGAPLAGPEAVAALDARVRGYSAFVVIIGPHWQWVTDAQGRPRLDDPFDSTHLLIEAALRQRIPVLPVLVEGASVLDAGRLPRSLHTLAGIRPLLGRYDPDFEGDIRALIAQLEQWVRVVRAPLASSSGGVTYPVVVRVRRKPRALLAVAALALVIASGGYVALSRQSQPRQTSIATPTPNPIPSPTAIPSHKHVVYTSALTSPDSNWPNDAHCYFRTDGYHVTDGWACGGPLDHGNFDLTVRVTLTNATLHVPWADIHFRSQDNNNFYDFLLYDDGSWAFFQEVIQVDNAIVTAQPSQAIHAGLGAVNTIEIRARGSAFQFFVNGVSVGQDQDSTFLTPGKIYLGASGATCIYSNITLAVYA
ncbi:MAG: hypothetical protein OJF49_003345 [Ktedonobacterales bacterium]|nr:MAG: hypothetical protein OJF49_003345 [Ktedonobacterales bacterium]